VPPPSASNVVVPPVAVVPNEPNAIESNSQTATAPPAAKSVQGIVDHRTWL
jgi:hypothetical protein